MRIIIYIAILLFYFPVYAQDYSSEDYIRKYHKIAIAEMHIYGIPASITLAQGILESLEMAIPSLLENQKIILELNVTKDGREGKYIMMMMKQMSVLENTRRYKILIGIILSFCKTETATHFCLIIK